MKRLVLLFTLFLSFAGWSQITVDETLTTQQLIEDVLIQNSCATVSNFQQSTGTNFGDVNGIGAFDQNGSSFPFAEGIILSSGAVANAPGPNNTLHSDGGFGWPGDADLENITGSGGCVNTGFENGVMDYEFFLHEYDVLADVFSLPVGNIKNMRTNSLGGQSQSYFLYPNPFTKGFKIGQTKEVAKNLVCKIEILNSHGEIVFENSNCKEVTDLLEIETNNFAKGLYFVKIYDSSNQTEVLKGIKH
jgi:Secretion system C-terminal sorting domain